MTQPSDVTVTIAKATPEYDAPTTMSAVYGSTLAELPLPDGFAWEQDESTPVGTVAGPNNFTATFTPKDTTNYLSVPNIPVNILVDPAQIVHPTIMGVIAPTRGARPVSSVTETEQYTGTIKWFPSVSTAFEPDTTYVATITLAPKPNYTLQGVTENFFAMPGAINVTNAAGNNVIVAIFPKTAAVVVKSGGDDSGDSADNGNNDAGGAGATDTSGGSKSPARAVRTSGTETSNTPVSDLDGIEATPKANAEHDAVKAETKTDDVSAKPEIVDQEANDANDPAFPIALVISIILGSAIVCVIVIVVLHHWRTVRMRAPKA
ncbi:MAG: hypothetical protein LBL63_02255 [Clostridiales Family XIII bacterium]|nr:hypothetical protein [Clostridiales Family XIII bacterium]